MSNIQRSTQLTPERYPRKEGMTTQTRTEYMGEQRVIAVIVRSNRIYIQAQPFCPVLLTLLCHNNVTHPSVMYWIGCLNLLGFCLPIVAPSS